MTFQLVPRRAVAFTGHRPMRLGGYDETTPKWRAVRRALDYEIRTAIADGYDTFITGLALGVDMVAAELVLESKRRLAPEFPIYLVGAAPFIGHTVRWPETARRRIANIVVALDQLVFTSEGGYEAWKMHRRNEWMIDHSAYLIAVWDGQPGGGTYQAVSYATRKGVPIRQIHPDYQAGAAVTLPGTARR